MTPGTTRGQNLGDRRRAHYLLARLDSERGRFDAALAHLLFVSSASGEAETPLRVLADLLIGEAHMKVGNFSEAEKRLRRAIDRGDALMAPSTTSAGAAATLETNCGDAVKDEWPLGLVLAWAHRTLADSHARRGGDFHLAEKEVELALGLARELRDLEEFRRADMIEGACAATTGRIRLRENEIRKAIDALQEAVEKRADSEMYLDLALAHERAAREAPDRRSRDAERDRAFEACESVMKIEAEGPFREAAIRLERRLEVLGGPDGTPRPLHDGERPHGKRRLDPTAHDAEEGAGTEAPSSGQS
jgi:tetratricopeptide (TPR) repeat protein